MKRTIAALLWIAAASTAHADGAATFAKKCAACHGKEGQGAKQAPNPIAGTAAAEVKKVLTEGKGKKKPMKIDDLDAVAEYVAGLKK